jgi:putative transposase
VRELKERYTRRMCDLSEFMKEIKQKFTQWYNKRKGKTGTLWEGRFKSVLVEDSYVARMTAVYIDLNPVQAEMVSDPKGYRWCSASEIEKTLKSGGKLSAAQMLHCKTRYFTDGVVLGSREFVDRFFSKMKEHRLECHTKRTTGARALRHVDQSQMYSLRDLRKDVYRV